MESLPPPTPQTFGRQQSFRFLSVTTLKNSSAFTSNLKMKRDFRNAFLCLSGHSPMLRGFRRVATVHDQTCLCVNWFLWTAFCVLVVDCDLRNSKNLTVIETGKVYFKCFLSVLSKIWHTYVIFVEYNLPVKIKFHSFPEVCFYEFIFVFIVRTHSLSLPERFRYTFYIAREGYFLSK